MVLNPSKEGVFGKGCVAPFAQEEIFDEKNKRSINRLEPKLRRLIYYHSKRLVRGSQAVDDFENYDAMHCKA